LVNSVFVFGASRLLCFGQNGQRMDPGQSVVGNEPVRLGDNVIDDDLFSVHIQMAAMSSTFL
jgi:hypothetical protein